MTKIVMFLSCYWTSLSFIYLLEHDCIYKFFVQHILTSFFLVSFNINIING
jgi:hypothetical protein